jgi:hypothetical protein
MSDHDDRQQEQHDEQQRLVPARLGREQQVGGHQGERRDGMQSQRSALSRGQTMATHGRHSVIHISWSLGARATFL